MSSSTLENISFFPYANFLRINGDMQMSSQCGGVASIVAILMILAILTIKLVEVFKMETIVSSFEATKNLEPPMTILSTFANSNQYHPYMLALAYYENEGNPSSASQFAFYVTRKGGLKDSSASTTYQPIPLEPCTSEHFSVIPSVKDKASSWGLSNWKCLPVNRTWQIGGDQQLSTTFKRIQVNMTCVTTENYADCGYYKLYTLNTFINPSDPSKPQTYYISSDTILVKGYSYIQYSSKLDSNILRTDRSILLGPKVNSTTSLQAVRVIQKRVMNNAPIYQTVLTIQRSGKTVNHNRSFLQLLDAIAYVGGIFTSILALFFFMGLYGRYHFEMKFAEYYFNSKQARNLGFFSWVKQAVYNALSSTPLKPQWQHMDDRNKLLSTVNKVLDIFYLHKRIGFLTQAVHLLLDSHHIKGLHLLQHASVEKSNQAMNAHKLRDRIIVFLSKYKSTQAFIFTDEQLAARGKESSKEQELFKSNTEILPEDKGVLKRIELIRSMSGESEREGKNINQLIQQIKQVQLIIQDQIGYIGLMSEQELNEGELMQDIEKDLARLLHEGESRAGQQRQISQKLCKKMHSSLKLMLKLAAKQTKLNRNLLQLAGGDSL